MTPSITATIIAKLLQKFNISHKVELIVLEEVMRCSRKVVELVYKSEQDKDNPLKSKYSDKRVWADGLCIEMEPRLIVEFEQVLEEALDRLPSLKDTLIYFNDLGAIGHNERQLEKFKLDRLAIIKTFLSKRNLSCTVLEEQGMAILAFASYL